jgi:hypothetical protein
MLQVAATGTEKEEEEDLHKPTFFAVSVKFGQNVEMGPSVYTDSCLSRRRLNGLRVNLE